MSREKKLQRLDKANHLLQTIGSCGRRFMGGSRLVICERGHVWFVDGYTKKRIYLAYKYWERGFSSGGTMRHVVNCLYTYVRTGEPAPPGVFGPWPEWLCDGDVWGYGDDMQLVRDKAKELEICT